MRVKLYDKNIPYTFKYGPGVIESAVENFNKNESKGLLVHFGEADGQGDLSNIVGTANKIELDNEGNLWGDIQLLDTSQGKLIKELLDFDKDSISFQAYGLGRMINEEIIDYEITGVVVAPKHE